MLSQLAFFTKAAATVYLVREYVAELTLCMGPSMLPTLNTSGDIVLVEHITARTGRLRVGDVVIARSVQNPKHIVCKRIRGLEGDLVEIQGSSYLPDRIVKVRFHTCVTHFSLALVFQKCLSNHICRYQRDTFGCKEIIWQLLTIPDIMGLYHWGAYVEEHY